MLLLLMVVLLMVMTLLLMLLLVSLSSWVAPWMSSLLKKSSSKQIFNINASSKATTWKSKASSWKTKSSRESTASLLLELLLLCIFIACEIIHPSSFRVLQQFISINYFLKFFFSPWVFFIAVWMILFGSLLESSLNLFFSGVLWYAQHLIGVGDFAQNGREECQEDYQHEQKLVHITCELTNYYYKEYRKSRDLHKIDTDRNNKFFV